MHHQNQSYTFMRKDVLIQLLEDGDKVSLYSVKFKGEELSEFEKFLTQFGTDEFAKDMGVILARLNTIQQLGADDRHFRYEGRISDRVRALPAKYIDSSRLRLYCLNINNKILVLGNGGMKESQTYQEDQYLNKCVETLQKIDFEIRMRENRRAIVIIGTHLEGELSFYIDD